MRFVGRIFGLAANAATNTATASIMAPVAARILCAGTMLSAATFATAQDQLWTAQFGSSGWDIAHALASDGTGGVVVAGETSGNLGGASAGLRDAFVARYDPAGTPLWVRQLGTRGNDYAHALAPDGAGGVMVAGWTLGILGGASAGNDDAFVARYDASGTQLWVSQFGTNGIDRAHALAPDGAGGVMVAGWTVGNLGGVNAGGIDAFVARYDAAGTQLWVRQFGTSWEDRALALAPDGAGGVMVAGWTLGILGGASAGFTDAFVARYDAAGNQLWIRQFGTGASETAYALAPDGAGGVMVTGTTWGDLSGANAGSSDAFVARYDAAGTQLWVRQFGTGGSENAYALAPDGTGGVMVAGTTNGVLGGVNTGGADAFVAQYDASGTQIWVRQFGTNGEDHAYALAPDGASGVLVAGKTYGNLGGVNAGIYDAYVVRFVPCTADLDTSTGAGVLDIFDFLAFQNAFVHGEIVACDCDTSTGWLVCDIFDFLCFQDAFVAGCP